MIATSQIDLPGQVVGTDTSIGLKFHQTGEKFKKEFCKPKNHKL